MTIAMFMNLSARHTAGALARASFFAAALLCARAALADDPWALDAQAATAQPARAQAGRAKRAAGGELWRRIRRGFAMPELQNGSVEQSEARYRRAPAEMTAMLERSRPYLYHIVEQLQKRRMPMELALLPMVESAFDPLAFSSARASGLWQFIPATGQRYQLTQNWWYDGRRDIIASTEAALDYLQALHRLHGDWHLALASYNWGEHAVARAIEENRRAGLPTDYSSLRLPEETRRYVPKLQALKNMLREPERFGVELPGIPNAPYFATVSLERDIDLRLAAELAEMPLEELVQLNPGHNRPVVDPSVTPRLVLPASRVDCFLRSLEQHGGPLSAWATYTLKPGDGVDEIAAAHGISPQMLRRVNSLPRRAVLHPGDALLVPLPAHASADEFLPAALHPLLKAAGRARPPALRPAKFQEVVAPPAPLADVRASPRVDIVRLVRVRRIGEATPEGIQLAYFKQNPLPRMLKP
jgi:membrane-bound lytic murein transglycosylase D